MGKLLHRIKGWFYIIVMVVVVALILVRAYNALQRTSYRDQQIFYNSSGIRISLSYPSKIFGSKVDGLYPLTIVFVNHGEPSTLHEYEIIFESSTLIFTNSKGEEITPNIQVASDKTYLEKGIYVRPFLTDEYPEKHEITVKILVDGKKTIVRSDFIYIYNYSLLCSYVSLFSDSILEISIVLGLSGWIIKTLDDAQAARKQLMEQRRNQIRVVASLTIFEQMRKVIELENLYKGENWDEDIVDELNNLIKILSSSEPEFFQAVGDGLLKDKINELVDLELLYNHFFNNHKESISVLAKIINNVSLDQPVITVINKLVKLWDEFDTDINDLMIGILVQLSHQASLKNMPAHELEQNVFRNYDRRRLLRFKELQSVFPQLIDPITGKPLPIGYDASWLKAQSYKENPQIVSWLSQHYLATNPFGYNDFESFPFFPEGFSPPDNWGTFLEPVPLIGECIRIEDAKALSFLLRDECLPIRIGEEPNQIIESKRQIFPIFVSIKQSSEQLPLCTLAHSAAQTWLDILPSCSDALLDLEQAKQQALIELLCWSLGSKNTVVDLIKRNSFGEDKKSQMLIRKITEFENKFSSANLPQDAVILSWLKIRPPDLNLTYFILPIDEFHPSVTPWWLEHFRSSISTLFLNGIVTKVLTSTSLSNKLTLHNIELSWSDGLEGRLSRSLEGQFDAAMDPEEKSMGKSVRFHELFGPGMTEKETTKLLVTSSNHSLSHMLKMGNLLLQEHSRQDNPEKYLSPEELNDILKTT